MKHVGNGMTKETRKGLSFNSLSSVGYVRVVPSSTSISRTFSPVAQISVYHISGTTGYLDSATRMSSTLNFKFLTTQSYRLAIYHLHHLHGFQEIK